MDKSDQYFDSLCRTCMHELLGAASYNKNSKQQQWISIFDRIEEELCSLPIAELLAQAVPQIEVQLSDMLPKIICSKCLQQLLIVHRFQQMCLQSEQKMRQKVSDLEKSTVEAATVSEIETIDAVSFLMSRFQPTQQPLLETTEQVVKTEPAEVDDNDHMQNIDQSLQHCRDSQGGFREVIKNEPIENDGPSIEYAAGGTMHSIFDVKDEVLSIECEEQQVNEMTCRNRPNYHQDEDKAYECPSCPRRFNTYFGMHQHKAIHEGIKRKDCDICGKSVIKNQLKQHKRTHNKVKPNKCDFCEKRFTRPTDLRIHMRVHTGEKPYKCKYCERSFSASGERMKHMRNHLGENVHRCELCPLAFPAPSELRKHLTMHKNEDPETRERNMKALKEAEAELQEKLSKKSTQQSSKDEIKSKRNAQKDHLRHGEEIKEKFYECPYCPQRFHLSSNMYHHKRIHEGIKLEACDICGKLINKYNLKQHKLTHSTEKAHKCDFCGKCFVHINYLRKHMPIHTGEKKYKCKYCERAFGRYNSYRNHMTIHLGVNIHRCELCPLAFPVAKELRVHFATHKDEDSDTRKRNLKALQEAEAKLQLKLSKNETQQPSKEESNQQLEIKAKE